MKKNYTKRISKDGFIQYIKQEIYLKFLNPIKTETNEEKQKYKEHAVGK